MTAAPATAGPATAAERAPTTSTVQLVGVVPADTAVQPGFTLLPYRSIAAVLAPAPADGQLRSALLSFTDLLDRLATPGPVIPVRFGTTLASPAAVTEQVLRPHHDTLAGTLATLHGRAQLTLRARYLPDEVVREVLAESPPLQELHKRAVDQAGRARLGELLAKAVAGKRSRDTELLLRRLEGYATSVAVIPAADLDLQRLADAAFLVEHDRRAEFEQAAGELAELWHGRARLSLLGPMAAYHFTGNLRGGW